MNIPKPHKRKVIVTINLLGGVHAIILSTLHFN
jgi:hypothetical protein